MSIVEALIIAAHQGDPAALTVIIGWCVLFTIGMGMIVIGALFSLR